MLFPLDRREVNLGMYFLKSHELLKKRLHVCRFVLQPGMLPEDARLAHDLLALRHTAAALEDAANTHQAADFADTLLLVGGRCFRWLCRVAYPVHTQFNAYPMHFWLHE